MFLQIFSMVDVKKYDSSWEWQRHHARSPQSSSGGASGHGPELTAGGGGLTAGGGGPTTGEGGPTAGGGRIETMAQNRAGWRYNSTIRFIGGRNNFTSHASLQ